MPDTIPVRINPFRDQRPRKGQPLLIDEVVAKPASIRIARLDDQGFTSGIDTQDQVLTFRFDAKAPLLMWHDGCEKPNVGEFQLEPHPDQPRAMFRYHAEDAYVHIESLERWLYWIGVFKDGQETHLRIGTTDRRGRIRLLQTSQGPRNLPVRDLTCAAARSRFRHAPE